MSVIIGHNKMYFRSTKGLAKFKKQILKECLKRAKARAKEGHFYVTIPIHIAEENTERFENVIHEVIESLCEAGYDVTLTPVGNEHTALGTKIEGINKTLRMEW